MSTSSTRICTTVLRFTVLLCCWLQAHHNVLAANVTVQNTDPSIVYSPVESWFPSSNLCSTCLNPGISISYHEGINSAPGGPDPTVVSTSSTSIPTASTSIPTAPTSISTAPTSIPTASTSIPIYSTSVISTTPPLPPPPTSTSSPILVVSSQGSSPPTVSSSSPSPPPTDGDGGGGSSHGKGKDGRALERRSGSVVTLSYNFTGTAIYLFSIQPPTEASVGANMNLSFTLDNQPAGSFSPTESSTEFLPNTNVLSLDGLSNQSHQLVVTVGNNSVFLFDYLIYTNSSAGISVSSTTAASGKKNNVATFAGALGGSVGVLALLSLGIAISIIRRRILAARRDRLDNEANGTGGTASMSGPLPFVPRFFPDTIISRDPPTYNDALSSTNHNNTPLLASLASGGLGSIVYASRQRSYANIPPDSLPSPLDELPPPPPFPRALSAPVLDRPADVTIPSISAENQSDLGSDSSFNVNSPLEDTPLLQSNLNFDTRPRSRTSTRSLELYENSETDLHQEDFS